jgi:hypothetical protein
MLRIPVEFTTRDLLVTLYGLVFSLTLGQCYDCILAPSEMHYAESAM